MLAWLMNMGFAGGTASAGGPAISGSRLVMMGVGALLPCLLEVIYG